MADSVSGVAGITSFSDITSKAATVQARSISDSAQLSERSYEVGQPGSCKYDRMGMVEPRPLAAQLMQRCTDTVLHIVSNALPPTQTLSGTPA